MLIKEQAKINDIVTFRLTTGEEIVGKLKEDNSDSYYIGKPVLVGIVARGEEYGLQMSPMILGTAPKGVDMVFNKSGILIRPLKSNEETIAEYTKMTSSIIVPPAGSSGIIGG